HGSGGRVSYNYRVLKHTQVCEGNTYVAVGNNPINAYNSIPSAPACTTTTFAACYNPDADFTYSLLDVPHRVIIAPMFELPFGKGKKWGANSGLVNVNAGGWLITTAINIQCGFPLSVIQTGGT